MKFISIVTPCLNEEGNIREIYTRIKAVFDNLPDYKYEHIFIDNASDDKTIEILKEIAKEDKNIKIIINTRNFGQVRSPMHAILHAKGDAVISLCSDLEDPPELIPEFIKKWEEGHKLVLGIKKSTKDSFLMFLCRKIFYRLMEILSDSGVKQIKNFTGFGLYDKEIIELMRKVDDPCPYIRYGNTGDNKLFKNPFKNSHFSRFFSFNPFFVCCNMLFYRQNLILVQFPDGNSSNLNQLIFLFICSTVFYRSDRRIYRVYPHKTVKKTSCF